MKLIPLSAGKSAAVDDDDYEYLMQWSWHARKGRTTFYAARTNSAEKAWTTTFMHRVILAAPKGVFGDHRDHNGLNNQRANLRSATGAENAWNRRPRKGSSSRFKGVYWHKGRGEWRTAIQPAEGKINLGTFKSEIEAALAYDAAARQHFGEFAFLNAVLLEELSPFSLTTLKQPNDDLSLNMIPSEKFIGRFVHAACVDVPQQCGTGEIPSAHIVNE